MKAAFADTSFFLALINPRDQYHNPAVELNSLLSAPLVTTEWVYGAASRRYFGLPPIPEDKNTEEA